VQWSAGRARLRGLPRLIVDASIAPRPAEAFAHLRAARPRLAVLLVPATAWPGSTSRSPRQHCCVRSNTWSRWRTRTGRRRA